MTRLVVQLTTDAPEKVATALTVAMTAQASGAQVHLWLSGPATLLAVPGQEPDVSLAHAPDPQQALGAVAAVHICSQCAARRGLEPADLRPGADIAGAAVLVEMLLAADTRTVTY